MKRRGRSSEANASKIRSTELLLLWCTITVRMTSKCNCVLKQPPDQTVSCPRISLSTNHACRTAQLNYVEACFSMTVVTSRSTTRRNV